MKVLANGGGPLPGCDRNDVEREARSSLFPEAVRERRRKKLLGVLTVTLNPVFVKITVERLITAVRWECGRTLREHEDATRDGEHARTREKALLVQRHARWSWRDFDSELSASADRCPGGARR
jgi:hypothetical protein